MSKYPKKPRSSTPRQFSFFSRYIASLSITLIAITSGATAPGAVAEDDSRWKSQVSSYTASQAADSKEFSSFIEEKQTLQLRAEQEQLENEDSQLYWEARQKHWEEVYRIYADDYAVSMRQMEIAEREGWVEDVKQRKGEAAAAWAIAVDAKRKAENALENAQANLAQAQSHLSDAKIHLKQKREATVARFEGEEAAAAEALEKCHNLQPVLRPIFASGRCHIEEEMYSTASRRTLAARQSYQLSEEGDMASAHEWEETANTHTKELARLDTEQLHYRVKLIGLAIALSLATVVAATLFVLATQQQKARRQGEQNSSQLALASQAFLSTVLSEELHLHMLEVLDEMLEREDATPLTLNLRLSIKLMSLLIAQLRIALDNLYDSSERASISSSQPKQMDDSSVDRSELDE